MFWIALGEVWWLQPGLEKVLLNFLVGKAPVNSIPPIWCYLCVQCAMAGRFLGELVRFCASLPAGSRNSISLALQMQLWFVAYFSLPVFCVYSWRRWLSRSIVSEQAGDTTAADSDLSGMSSWNAHEKCAWSCSLQGLALNSSSPTGQVYLIATTGRCPSALGHSPSEGCYFLITAGEYWSLEENNLALFALEVTAVGADISSCQEGREENGRILL